MILISACLIGEKCKYNGEHNLREEILNLYREGNCIAICPESKGGLPIPRPPSEIQGGTGKDVILGKAKVFNKEGKDVTEYFIKGAKYTLEVCKRMNIKKAILKARSPSCGVKYIYDGTFSGTLKKGRGVTAEMLFQNGIEIISDEEFSSQHPFCSLAKE